MTAAAITRNILGLNANTRYIIRVRAYNGLGVPSDWSEALLLTTDGGAATPDAPTALVISYSTPTLILGWTAPTLNTDGSSIAELLTYKIVLTSGATSVTYTSSTNSFVYTIDQNRADFGVPQSVIDVSIFAVNNLGNQSAALTGVATSGSVGGTVDPPTALTAYSALASVILTWTASDSLDVDHYDVHISTTTGFTPSATTLFGTAAATDTLINVNQYYNGTAWVPLVIVPSPVTYYFKLVARDAFGASSTPSTQVSAAPSAVGDSVVVDQTIIVDKLHDGTLWANAVLAGSITAGTAPNTVTLGSTGLVVENSGLNILSALVSGVTICQDVVINSTQMRSSNYTGLTGSPGWAVNRDGSAYFANVYVSGTVSASTFLGGNSVSTSGGGGSSSDYLHSANWNGSDTGSINGTAGWAIYGTGNAYFNNSFLRGAINATSGSIGGWAIGSTTLTGGGVTLNSSSGTISGATVIGGVIETASSGARVAISASTDVENVLFYDGSSTNPGRVGVYAANTMRVSAPYSAAPGGGAAYVEVGTTSVTLWSSTSSNVNIQNANFTGTPPYISGSWVSGAVASATTASQASGTLFALSTGGAIKSGVNDGYNSAIQARWYDDSTWEDFQGLNLVAISTVYGGTKSFIIDHPLDNNKYLQYATIEGPQHDLIHRGRAQLKDGYGIVDIDKENDMTPGTLKAFTRNPQIFLYNETGTSHPKGNYKDGILNITCDDKDAQISWLVIVERCDSLVMDHKDTNEHGKLVNEGVKYRYFHHKD